MPDSGDSPPATSCGRSPRKPTPASVPTTHAIGPHFRLGRFSRAEELSITDGLTGLYALPGPGGWPLVGRTPVPLFEARSDQPFLLRAGMRVRLTAIDEKVYRRMVAK